MRRVLSNFPDSVRRGETARPVAVPARHAEDDHPGHLHDVLANSAGQSRPSRHASGHERQFAVLPCVSSLSSHADLHAHPCAHAREERLRRLPAPGRRRLLRLLQGSQVHLLGRGRLRKSDEFVFMMCISSRPQTYREYCFKEIVLSCITCSYIIDLLVCKLTFPPPTGKSG